MDEDDLTFDLKRRIECDTKEEEIRKAKRALRIKKERGDDFGRLVSGMRTTLRKHDSRLRDEGKTYAVINDETGVSKGTVSNILDRRNEYLEDAKEHDIALGTDVLSN